MQQILGHGGGSWVIFQIGFNGFLGIFNFGSWLLLLLLWVLYAVYGGSGWCFCRWWLWAW